jgi:transcription factor SPN1
MQARQERMGASGGGGKADATSLIAGKASKGQSQGVGDRVSVPFSKGFQFTIRPANKVDEDTKSLMESKKVKSGGVMEKLNKSMIEKARPLAKNQRSQNMSINGTAAKN